MRLAPVVASLVGGVSLALAAHSIVPGRAFDRFVYVILENQDFVKVNKDSHFKELAAEGISLERFFALTHPSQPNYVAALAGDYFGLNHDNVIYIPGNVSTVVDLLEARGVSWGAYMEDIPSPGYLGPYSDGTTGKGWDYVRKHNPFAIFDSISYDGGRLRKIQGFNEFGFAFLEKDLPQFVFLTPNMMHDGHNTSLSKSLAWTHDFLKPLLADGAFSERTLIMLSYDEADDYSKPNQIATLLLGNAIPKELKGTSDNTFYTHYSMLSTVEFNWRLPNLGRYDVGANIFQWVEDYAKDSIFQNKDPPNVEMVNNSVSYGGALNNESLRQMEYPPPNLFLTGAGGEPILGDIIAMYKNKMVGDTPYDGSGEVFCGDHPPVYKPQAQL